MVSELFLWVHFYVAWEETEELLGMAVSSICLYLDCLIWLKLKSFNQKKKIV